MLEFKPRLKEAWGQGLKPAEACCPTAGSFGHIPNKHRHATPVQKKGGMVDPGPEAVETELHHPAEVRPHTKRFQCGALSGAGSRRLLPSTMAKVWNRFLCSPNPPNRGAETTRVEVAPFVQMQKAKQ